MNCLNCFILLLLLSFIKCTKDKIPFYSGHAGAELNDEKWSAKVHFGQNLENNQLYDVLISQLSPEGFDIKGLYIFQIKLMYGRQKIYKTEIYQPPYLPGCNYSTSMEAEYDVLCDYYDISSDTLFNHLTITEIKTLPRIVTGKFDLKLIISRLPKCDISAKDTLVFSMGSFIASY